MKQDQLSSAIINFLIPVTLLYASLVVLDYANYGVVSIIHSGIIIFLAIIIILFKVKEPLIQHSLKIKVKILTFITFLALFFLFASILVTITDIFSL